MAFRILVYVSFLLWAAFLTLPLCRSSASVTDLISDKNKTCEKIQTKFALAAQEFIYCSIVNARPITFCESCVTSYLDVLTVHQEILTGEVNGASCRNQLINVDRLEIIETLFTSVDRLWTRGECTLCFVVTANGTTTSKLNNNTMTFQKMNSVVKKCVQDNEPKNKPDICITCRDSYEKLNVFYNKLKRSEVSSHVCMDIVDSMNASRMEWSKDLGCSDIPGIDLPFILSTCFMNLVPVIFYVALWKFSSRIECREQQ